MNRRTLLAALGAVGGVSGVIGSGAFTSVVAERTISVETAADEDALVGLEPIDTANGRAYATTAAGDRLALAFGATEAGGSGLGADSTYQLDDVFRVTNRGTQPVYVWATFAGADESALETTGPNPDVYVYPNGDAGDVLRDSEDDVSYLGVGESVSVGVFFDTTGVAVGELDLTVTINAAATNPASGAVVAGDGTTIPGPTGGLAAHWPLDRVGEGVAEDVVGGADGSVPEAVTAAAGKSGGAVQFPEEDQFVETTARLGVGSPFSLAVWANAAGFDQTEYPLAVSKWQRARNRDYLIGYHGPEGRLYTQFNREPDGNKATLFGPEPETGVWYHCVLTYDRSGRGRFYVDGSVVGETQGPFGTSSSQFVIGSKDGGGNSWHGRVEDVRLYDRALDPGEVTALYDATK
ncbi:LamG-like jellyroll fold domain-containing protein [Halobaculum sp. MBLA0143]|uniref:LamG-like jellyroll fold domain-containing protein n=1 Tax=Halobaculum sp. MBLA0143 TaxID=3079933 RepID=UPI0035233493